MKTEKDTTRLLDVTEKNMYHIRLDNLMARGFPSNILYKWYSWLRFNIVVDRNVTDIDIVLDNEQYFLNALHEVNKYYMKNTSIRDSEELQPFMGPQTYDQFCNPTLRHEHAEILHYYGKGTIKWYKESEFKKHLKLLIGGERYKIIEHELFGYDPFTPNVSKVQFHYLLHSTNQSLSKHLTQDSIHLKLEPFSGPQCHEDRGNDLRMKYNPDFRFKQPILKPYKVIAE